MEKRNNLCHSLPQATFAKHAKELTRDVEKERRARQEVERENERLRRALSKHADGGGGGGGGGGGTGGGEARSPKNNASVPPPPSPPASPTRGGGSADAADAKADAARRLQQQEELQRLQRIHEEEENDKRQRQRAKNAEEFNQARSTLTRLLQETDDVSDADDQSLQTFKSDLEAALADNSKPLSLNKAGTFLARKVTERISAIDAEVEARLDAAEAAAILEEEKKAAKARKAKKQREADEKRAKMVKEAEEKEEMQRLQREFEAQQRAMAQRIADEEASRLEAERLQREYDQQKEMQAQSFNFAEELSRLQSDAASSMHHQIQLNQDLEDQRNQRGDTPISPSASEVPASGVGQAQQGDAVADGEAADTHSAAPDAADGGRAEAEREAERLEARLAEEEEERQRLANQADEARQAAERRRAEREAARRAAVEQRRREEEAAQRRRAAERAANEGNRLSAEQQQSRDRQRGKVWGAFVEKVEQYETNDKRIPIGGGRTWDHISEDVNLTAQDEGDAEDVATLASDTGHSDIAEVAAENERKLKDEMDEDEEEVVDESYTAAELAAAAAKGASWGKKAPPMTIELTRKSLQYLQQTTPRDRDRFISLMRQFTLTSNAWAGGRGVARVIQTKHTPKDAVVIAWVINRRTKVTAICQERPTEAAIIVWTITTPGAEAAAIKEIDRMYKRMLPKGQENSRHKLVPEVFLNPRGNTPIIVHRINVGELDSLQNNSFMPDLRLTNEESALVEREGCVLVLGRSGTGKTSCTAMRIAGDLKSGAFRQLFVARSSRLCRNLKRIVVSGNDSLLESVENDIGALDVVGDRCLPGDPLFLTLDQFIAFLESMRVPVKDQDGEDEPYITFPPLKRVGYFRFEKWWHETKGFTVGRQKKGNSRSGGGGGGAGGGGAALGPLAVWTQIRSLIKGSCEAAFGSTDPDINPPRPAGSPIYRNEYLGFGRKRVDLSEEQRNAVFDIYEVYAVKLMSTESWDDGDRVLYLIACLRQYGDSASCFRDSLFPVDKLYADEVQDSTQCEVALMVIAVGCHADNLWLVGDTAQAVTHGVNFRFDDVRTVVTRVGGRIDKPAKLSRNYRSHSGILNYANTFLSFLATAFPHGMRGCLHLYQNFNKILLL